VLRVGVIGVGHWGRHHARVYSELEDADLVGVADIRADQAIEVAGRYACQAFEDFRQLADRIDAVSVAVPTEDHVTVAEYCLRHGVDALVEKPIAADVEGARSLIALAERNGRTLQVGHVEQFNPVVQAARSVATQPQFFEIHRLSQFSTRSLDIDVVLDLMIHDIDIVSSMVEAPAVEVRAVGIPVLSGKADIANVRLEFADGCVANLTASRVSVEKVRKLRFFQPHDYVSLDYAAQAGYVLSLESGRIRRKELAPERVEPLKSQLAAFVAAAGERRPPAVTGTAGLQALELALQVNREIEAHRSKSAIGGV
jgi:predicted dehydrogenase